jgi:hypothetical protein
MHQLDHIIDSPEKSIKKHKGTEAQRHKGTEKNMDWNSDFLPDKRLKCV